MAAAEKENQSPSISRKISRLQSEDFCFSTSDETSFTSGFMPEFATPKDNAWVSSLCRYRRDSLLVNRKKDGGGGTQVSMNHLPSTEPFSVIEINNK